MAVFWKIVGIALLGWAAWDIYHGYTYLTGLIYRAEQPALFWGVVSVWIILGISCLWPSRWN